MFNPDYTGIAKAGDYKISLTEQEAAVVLKIHDYGIDFLTEDERTELYKVIGNLKTKIHP